MKFRRIAVGMIGALMLMTTSVFADYEYNTDQQYAQTNTTTQQSWETTTTTTTTVTSPAMIYVPAPAENPARVKLDVGEIKDGAFSAKLNIESPSPIANASISISYDTELLDCTNASFNSQTGGTPVGNDIDGKYVYNYTNPVGSDFDGVYLALKFSVLDDTMQSTVIYVTVTNLDDVSLSQIAYQTENGVVNAGGVSTEGDGVVLPAINLTYSDKEVSVEECGLANVDSVTIENTDIATFSDGFFKTASVGDTTAIVQYQDGTAESYTINVLAPETVAAVATVTTPAQTTPAKPDSQSDNRSHTFRNVLIVIAILVAVGVIVGEYITIVKPFDKKKAVSKKSENSDEADENNVEENDDSTLEEIEEEQKEASDIAEDYNVIEDDIQETDDYLAVENEDLDENEFSEEPNFQIPYEDMTDEERIDASLKAQGFVLPNDKE